MIPHYYHIHETSSGGQGRARAVEIATFEPRFRVPHETGGEDHMAVCYKAGSLALLLNGGGDHAHIFWTPSSKETRDGVYNVKDRSGG